MLRRVALAAALIAAAPVAARDFGKVVMPLDPKALAQQERYGYAQAIRSGDMIYLSGVVAGPVPGETSLEPAFDRAFQAIEAILGRANATWDDVVDITTFHTDLAGQAEAFAAVKNRYVKAPFPAWTAIGISKLFEPSAVVEIKVVAEYRHPE